MKKRNLFMYIFVALCLVAFNSKAYAAETTSFSNQQLICDPDSVEADGTSTCYLIGNISGEIEGFYLEVYTMDGIKFDDAKSDYIYGPTSAKPTVNILEYGATATLTRKVDGSTETAKCYANKDNASWTLSKGTYPHDKSSVQAKCAFLSNASYTKDSSINQNVDQKKNFAAVAAIRVKGTEVANETCGAICITAKYIPAYASTFEYSYDVNSDVTIGAGADTNSKSCMEITLKPKKTNPETGAFISYVALALFACVSIVLIKISSKKNKMFNV